MAKRQTRPAGPHILYVCRTCPRYEPPLPAGEVGRGEALANRIKDLAEDWPLAEKIRIRAVNCLSGCPNPCNVSLGAPGKTRVRFSRLGPDDAPAVLEVAGAYFANRDGVLAPEQVPESLRDRLSALSPPQIVRGPMKSVRARSGFVPAQIARIGDS